MSETVTAVPELFSVTINIAYSHHQKVHVVAELFRHGPNRKFMIDTQVAKTAASSDLLRDVGSCLTRAVGALTAPATGFDSRVSGDTPIFHGGASCRSIAELIWHTSHGGRNSTALCVEMWVVMV